MADDSSTPAGDGLLADQGSQDFGSLTGQTGTPSTPATETTQTQTAPASEPGTTQQPAQGQPATTQTPAVQPTQQQQQPDLSAIIRSTVDATAAALSQRQQGGQQQTQQPQQLSAQDFDRKYGIIRPTEAHLTHILGQDPKAAVAALDNLFQANLTAALRMSNDLVEAKLSEVQRKYDPHVKSWEQHQQNQQSAAAEDRFFKAYPQLAPERDLVLEMKDAFITKVQSGQVRFADENQAFQAVATATNAILAKVRGGATGGQTQPGQAQTQQHQNGGIQPSGRQMSAASSAGRTGTGQAAAQKSVVDEVFGMDAR